MLIRKYLIKYAALVILGISVVRLLLSQVAPSSAGAGQSLWVGADYSNIHADFPYGSNVRLSGVGTSSVFNWNHHLGIEGNVVFDNFNSFNGEKQQSFLAGPRYTFLHSATWKPYAMFQLGDTKITYPFSIGSYNYFAMAPGAGIEYQFKPHWSLKAEYRYQFLHDAPGFTDEAQYGIKPTGFSIGVNYRLKLWHNLHSNK